MPLLYRGTTCVVVRGGSASRHPLAALTATNVAVVDVTLTRSSSRRNSRRRTVVADGARVDAWT